MEQSLNAYGKILVKLDVLEQSIDVNDAHFGNPPNSIIVDGSVTDVISEYVKALHILPLVRLETVVTPSGKIKFVI